MKCNAMGGIHAWWKLMDSTYSPPGGKDRWVGEKDGSHELYCAGHLYEAAAAHYLATGKRNLFDVALKNADLVCSTFGPNGRHEVPGHQVIEIGLCKLYRITGEEKYLRTAKFFLDERGLHRIWLKAGSMPWYVLQKSAMSGNFFSIVCAPRRVASRCT